RTLRPPVATLFPYTTLFRSSVLVLTGCPWFPTTPQLTYDSGYTVGFLRDDYYWNGFFDSYDSLTYDDVFYAANDIPFIDDNSYRSEEHTSELQSRENLVCRL